MKLKRAEGEARYNYQQMQRIGIHPGQGDADLNLANKEGHRKEGELYKDTN